MTTLAKQDNCSKVNKESFEDTYKTAYSHGFESIYALEVVDPSSIRPMSKQASIEPEITLNEDKQVTVDDKTQQLELDLSGAYRKWIKPFFLKEPIQVLGLSLLAEKTCLDNNIKVIQDLLGENFESLVHMKGMGQGHIDEVQRALQSYINGRDTSQAYEIDFLGCVRSLLGQVDRKKAKVALEPYGLDQCIEVSPSEQMQIKRLTLEARRDWIEEIYQLLTNERNTSSVHQDIKNLIDVFVKPWMWGRHGIAVEWELKERIERVAANERVALLGLNFIESVYFPEEKPFELFLFSVDQGVFCADEQTAGLYRDVIEKALSYFYLPHICYTLNELTTLLLREYSSKWQYIPEGLIEQVLRFSPDFRVRKETCGLLHVRLA